MGPRSLLREPLVDVSGLNSIVYGRYNELDNYG